MRVGTGMATAAAGWLPCWTRPAHRDSRTVGRCTANCELSLRVATEAISASGFDVLSMVPAPPVSTRHCTHKGRAAATTPH